MSELDIRYAKIDPEQVKDVYVEYDTVDFMIATDRNVIANSIRIEGDLRVKIDGTNRPGQNGFLFYEPNVGIHGVVESVSTQLGGGGEVVEFLQHYPRYVNMVEKATNSKDDYFQSSKICELKTASYEQTLDVMRGKMLRNNTNTISDGDFSFKPMFCLNRMSGKSLSLAPYNNLIKVSVQLARNKAFFCGAGSNDATTYELRNLKMTYRTLPAEPTPNVMANSYVSLKQTLESPSVSISSRVPAIASGVSVTYLEQASEFSNVNNNYQLEKIPRAQSLKFMFNNIENNFVTYEILDEGEMVQGYLESLKSSGLNQVDPTQQHGKSGYGHGASFRGMVDLRQSKFTMELESGIDLPIIAFMFFHSMVNLS